MARRRRLWLWIPLGIVAALGVGLGVLVLVLRHPMPPVVDGEDADALARALERSVDGAAWQRTGAVRWKMGGHEHLWDRGRGLGRVRFSGNEVLLDIGKRTGEAYAGGARVLDEGQRRKLVDKAYAWWCNDSFWLNPIVKLFDEGTHRDVVRMEDGTWALRVRYGSGGVTPGDTYVWIPGSDGRPRAVRMWVKIIPIGGIEWSWQGWTKLATGALVATEHHGLMDVKLDEVAGAATLGELVPGADPFAPIAGAGVAR